MPIQPAAAVDKTRKILGFLQDMQDEHELRTLALWRAHQLTGDRKGVWSLHVTKNWRITFSIDPNGIDVIELDYEDYH